MASWEHKLATPPKTPRAQELWLQHAAGFILFEDVRGYAIEQITPGLSPDALAAAHKGIDDALYGLMMVLDGVSGCLSNPRVRVDLRTTVRLLATSSGDEVVRSEVDLASGDGMCMGYHGWLEGDFGKDEVVATRRAKRRPTKKRTRRTRAV